MERRDLIKSAGAMAAIAVSGSSLARGQSVYTASKEDTLANCAAECITICEACITGCLAELAKGPSAEAIACINSCRDAVAACRALLTLVATQSPFLQEYAKVCAAICRACAETCAKCDDECCKQCQACCTECAEKCEQI